MQIRILISFLLMLSSIGQASWKASGSAETYFQQYTFPSAEEYSSQNGGLNAELKADWKSDGSWRFRSHLEMRTDALSKDSSEHFQGNPRSFYLENKSLPVVFRLGYQTMAIDGPDIVNPADVVHQRNYIDPTNPTVLASPGLSFSQEWEEWQWELFYIPVQTKPVLPGVRNPWLPREKELPIESENTEIRIPAEIRYEYGEAEELNRALKDNIAFKLQRKSEAFEAQLLFFEGLAKDPHLTMVSDVNGISLPPNPTPENPYIVSAISPIVLNPIYYRQQVLAGTFLLPVGSWVFKGGANLIKPVGKDDKNRIPEGYSTYVLGLEKNFETRKGMVTVILQNQQQKREAKNQISFLRSIFENAWTLGLRVPWGEETSFLGGAIYDTVGKSSVFRLGVSRRLGDSFTFEVDGQMIQGPEGTLLGIYEKYDRYGAGLTYHW